MLDRVREASLSGHFTGTTAVPLNAETLGCCRDDMRNQPINGAGLNKASADQKLPGCSVAAVELVRSIIRQTTVGVVEERVRNRTTK